VQAVVVDQGGEPVKLDGKIMADATGQSRASVEITRNADGKTDLKQSNGKKP